MSGINSSIGYPYVPVRKESSPSVSPPDTRQREAVIQKEFEHTWELVYFYLVNGVKNLKRLIKIFIIPLAIAMVINIILESIPTYSLSGIVRPIALFAIAVTASYNSLIPRTIYWIVIFTVGKKIFYRVRKEGARPTFKSFKEFPAIINNTKRTLGQKYLYVLATGTGFGFIAANFLTRNNRFDKSVVTVVLAIAILDTLLRGKRSMLFTAIKLIHKDLALLVKKKAAFSDAHVYNAGLGFALGLIGNLIFAVIKLEAGGYILGAILLIPGWVLLHAGSMGVKRH